MGLQSNHLQAEVANSRKLAMIVWPLLVSVFIVGYRNEGTGVKKSEHSLN